MKYMNKQLAEQTAENMLKSAREKITEKEMQQRVFAGEIAWKNVPEVDHETICRLADKGWIDSVQGFYFRNPLSKDRYSHTFYRTATAIPEKRDDKYIYPTLKEWEKLLAYDKEIKEMKDKMHALIDQIVATLLKLRTPERIQKDFPEAFECLPKDALGTKNEISLPIENIILSIEKFPA